MPFSSMYLRSSQMVFVLLVSRGDQLLYDPVVLSALVGNGAKALARRERIPQAQESDGIPSTDGVLAGSLSVVAAGDHPVV